MSNFQIYIYPLFVGLVLGISNWLYWRKQGYTSFSFLFLGCCVFYALAFIVMRKILN